MNIFDIRLKEKTQAVQSPEVRAQLERDIKVFLKAGGKIQKVGEAVRSPIDKERLKELAKKLDLPQKSVNIAWCVKAKRNVLKMCGRVIGEYMTVEQAFNAAEAKGYEVKNRQSKP